MVSICSELNRSKDYLMLCVKALNLKDMISITQTSSSLQSPFCDSMESSTFQTISLSDDDDILGSVSAIYKMNLCFGKLNLCENKIDIIYLVNFYSPLGFIIIVNRQFQILQVSSEKKERDDSSISPKSIKVSISQKYIVFQTKQTKKPNSTLKNTNGYSMLIIK